MTGVDNVLGAILGIVLLLASIASFAIGFAVDNAVGGQAGGLLLGGFFIVGIVLLSACLPVPVFLLERFEGVRDKRR